MFLFVLFAGRIWIPTSKLIIFNLFLAIFLVDRTTYNSFFFRWCQFFRRFLQQNTWSTSRNSTKYFDQIVLFHRQLLIKELIGASSRQFDNITTSITSVLFAKEQVVTLVKAYLGWYEETPTSLYPTTALIYSQANLGLILNLFPCRVS